jgi:hypothetical protein
MMSPNPELMRRYNTAAVFQEKLAGAASLTERLAGGLLGYGAASYNQNEADKAKAEGAAMTEMARELEMLKVDQYAQLLRGTPVPRFARPSLPMRGLPSGSIDDTQWNQDLDDGAVRLASVAAGAGADMAKAAGLGDFAGFAKGLAAKAVSAVGGALKPAAGAATQGIAGAAKSVLTPPPVGGAGGILAKGKQLLGGGLGLKTNLALGAAAAGSLYAGNKVIQGASHAAGSTAGPATYGGGSHGYRLPMTVNSDGQPQL